MNNDDMKVLGVDNDGSLLIASEGNIYMFDILSQSRVEEYQRWDREGQSGAIDCWREAVYAGQTEDGFSDWLEDVMRYENPLFYGHDDSWMWMAEEAFTGLTEEQQEAIVEALNERGCNDFTDAEEVLADFVSDARGWMKQNSLEESDMAYIADMDAFIQYGKKVAA